MMKQRQEEASADLHLRLSAKYMAYKDLADRCLLNPEHVGKYSEPLWSSNSNLCLKLPIERGERRVFYMKPKSPFLQEPRVQNQYRNEFVRQIGQAPCPEPLTFLADDLHKVS